MIELETTCASCWSCCMTLVPSHTCSAQPERPCKAPTIHLSSCVHSCCCFLCTANLQALPLQATAHSPHPVCVYPMHASRPHVKQTFALQTISDAWFLTADRLFKMCLISGKMTVYDVHKLFFHAPRHLPKVKMPGISPQQALSSDLGFLQHS